MQMNNLSILLIFGLSWGTMSIIYGSHYGKTLPIEFGLMITFFSMAVMIYELIREALGHE